VTSAALQLFRHPFRAMGSPCEIALYAGNAAEAKRHIDAAIADVERLEQRYSRYRADSLLSEINRAAAAGGSVEVDDETAGLLTYAETCWRESDGLFDITSGLLRQAWRFDQGGLPDPEVIGRLLGRIGWHRLRWRAPRLDFAPGMELDLGGIVKEYAVDRVATLSRNAGVRHGIINLGGDVRIIGPRPDGASWRIGIRHPRRREGMIESLELRGGSVATSGDYERCIVVDGVRYGHVLNPKTGWPVSHMAAVTVVGDLCVVAGSASTIAMLKEQDGPAWLERMGLPCLWVSVDGELGGTLAERVQGDAMPVG
jgi:thiamine biosynthesis lipoprotein